MKIMNNKLPLNAGRAVWKCRFLLKWKQTEKATLELSIVAYPLIPGLRRLRLEDPTLMASLSNLVKPYSRLNIGAREIADSVKLPKQA